MKTIKNMSMEELAAYVCEALEKEGIETVLSGGCCVELYSKGRYTSDGIDRIDRFNGGHRKIITAPIYNLKLDAGDFVHNQGRFLKS